VKRTLLFLALPAVLCQAVASAAPTPAVTITAPTELSGAGAQFYSGGTVWFRPDSSGSFNLNATGTAVASVKFPDISTMSGWAGSTGGKDTSSPYTSPVAYTWTAGAAAPGAQSVEGKTDTDETVKATVTISADSIAPTGQTISLVGGPFFATTSVPLTISRGSDTGAGVDPAGDVVERAVAPLENGTCGTFGQFAAVTLTSGTDTGVVTGNCYHWQLKVKDNVGNVSAAAASSDAKVDTTPPTAPTLLFTGLTNAGTAGNVVYYRPSAVGSFTLAAAASDPESGVTAYAFPTIPGATQVDTRSSRTFVFGPLTGVPSTPFVVTATNAAGVTSAGTSFTLVPDSTPPAVTIRCNGQPCTPTAYAGPVRVTFTGVDQGSGLDTIRYTTDGNAPTKDGGYEYTSAIVVRSLTHLKVRAFDKAGNAGNPLAVTIRSLADRLVFDAPTRIAIAKSNRYLKAQLSSTQRVHVLAVMTGRGLAAPQRWRFILERGTWIVQLRLPAAIRRGQGYSVRWTVSTGTKGAARVTQVSLR